MKDGVSDLSYSLQPHGLEPARLLCPWETPKHLVNKLSQGRARVGRKWLAGWGQVLTRACRDNPGNVVGIS